MKKPVGTKSVRESSNKHEVVHEPIGSFTENLSYQNEVNAISHQVKNNYPDQSQNIKNQAADNERQQHQLIQKNYDHLPQNSKKNGQLRKNDQQMVIEETPRKLQIQSPTSQIDVRKLAQIQLQDMELSQIQNDSFQQLQNQDANILKRNSADTNMKFEQDPRAPRVQQQRINSQKPPRQNQTPQNLNVNMKSNEQLAVSANKKKAQSIQFKQSENRGDDFNFEELPGLVTDDYQHDPYQCISKMKYLNMMISHAIATNDELKYMKLMQKLKQIETQNEEDKLLKSNLNMLQDKPFSEVLQLCITKTTRQSLNSALSLSIETKREIVAFDLVAFSIEMSFSLTITERQMQLLVKGEMYALIQDLVHGNTLLQIDARNLDADELLQVQRINRKKKREQNQHKETEKDTDSCMPIDSGAPSPNALDLQKNQTQPKMAQQFEGGYEESNTNGFYGTTRQRQYNGLSFPNNLERVLEVNDRNQPASHDRRFLRSGRQNRNEFNQNEQLIQEEVDPVSFNSRRNVSRGSIDSEELQNPEGQTSQRINMTNDYIARPQQYNNFHIQNQAQHEDVNSSSRPIIQSTAYNLLPQRYNRNSLIQGSSQYRIDDRDQQSTQQQIQQSSRQQFNNMVEQANQTSTQQQVSQRAQLNYLSQREQHQPTGQIIENQLDGSLPQIENVLNGTLPTNSQNSAGRNVSLLRGNRQMEIQKVEQKQQQDVEDIELKAVINQSKGSFAQMSQAEPQRKVIEQVNLINSTEQIHVMKNKFKMDIKKLNLPLPSVQEGPGLEDENALLLHPNNNLKNILQSKIQKNIKGFDSNQTGQTQIQTQAESMKIFTQLQESIKNLVKNNKFIVENNNVEKQAQIKKELPPAQETRQVPLVEKYLKISDFMEYILENKEIFLENKFTNVKRKDEEKSILNDFLKNFLMKTQDCIDFDKTVKHLIENKLHSMLIDELFEQRDDSFKIQDRTDPIPNKNNLDKFKSARYADIPTQQVNLFRKNARLKFLTQLIDQSVSMKQYQITYEVTQRFLSDLLKAKNLPIFDNLFTHLQEDTSRYEAKIALIFTCIPMMNRNVATRLMKVIEGVLQEPSDNSILKNNINPLRVGLMFYRVIDEIQTTFAYSEHSSKLMKDTLCDQIVKVLDMYNDPEDLLVLVEETDYEGNDCFWYLDEYDLYSLMGCRIMDRVIQKKWNGKFEVNATILDYSTAFTLMRDKYTIFATDWVFQELRHEMLTIDRSDKTHGFKFHVWQESMLLRSRVDAGFSLVLTAFFQWYLNSFSGYFQEAMTLCSQLMNINKSGQTLSAKDMEELKSHKYESMQWSSEYLQWVMYASLINLLFPINIIMEKFFLHQTKRKPSDLDINQINEMTLFIASLVLYIEFFKFYGSRENHNNLFLSADMTDDQVFIGNIIWAKQEGNYPIEYMLAILAGNCWIKLLLRLRVTQQFGPLFKVIQMMIIDLGIFLVLWIIILIMFSSASCMIFGQLPQFREFMMALYMYLEYSLGNWDTRIYCEFNQVENGQHLCEVGKIYTTIFLLSNMVLLLNLVIAILSSTFAFYEDKKLGLYYEVLVGKFPSMEYDDKYGAVVCAQPPFNLMILPFWWITLLPWTESLKKYLYHYNLFLCHLIYLPLGFMFTAFFTIQNLAYVPVAYFKHAVVLIQTLTDSDETMDEFSEKVTRFFTIIKFIFLAPFILMIAVPIDMIVFFKNLYTRPCSDDENEYKDIITPSSIEILQKSCQEVLRERQDQTKEKGTTHVNFVLLNKRLQKNLNVQKQIQSLIFDYSDDKKFITDPLTKTQKLNPHYLNRLREFNLLKRLVAYCADKTCMVDTELLSSLIDQVKLRCQMMHIKIHLGELETGRTPEEIRQASLKELSRTEPKTVESKLNEDGQVLEVILDQVSQIQQDMGQLKSEVKKSHKLKYDVSNIKSQIEINNQLLVGLMEQQKVGMMTLDSIFKKINDGEAPQTQQQSIPKLSLLQKLTQEPK